MKNDELELLKTQAAEAMGVLPYLMVDGSGSLFARSPSRPFEDGEAVVAPAEVQVVPIDITEVIAAIDIARRAATIVHNKIAAIPLRKRAPKGVKTKK